ncbi:uncharacterized protein LOC133503922 isoform X2 [Syngnathoides biaculeatus]|uniref:uncharacterized protein LOC133503922 isoform X2 n=1 Tax=Syngnathoides biaculeatus TaxID=300417 RepID=UPI002ADDC7DD|nr:uncharacterized protein LOC133503922 isoform X2 [Syngnathoides biaculeatus]
MVRKVAVIGAGPSGLTAVKACLEEDLQPTCFESSDDLGGLWKFKAISEPNRASIYRSLTINISKEMMCYSDFPIPADYPNYMHHSKILNYFRMYADHFKLLQHIRFQTAVKSVRPRPDYARTGKWEVVTQKQDGKEETHVFDAVICCSGHYTYPNLPLQDFPGLDSFQGRYFHSWDYKGPEDMHGKRVVVVGIGNSGSDIAVESSKFAEEVYMSTRRGAWVIRQVSDDGLPVDMKYNTRFVHILFQLFPINFFNWFGENKLNAMYDHTMYALKPKHRLFSQIPVINDDLPFKILSGSVIIKPNVKEVRGSSVIFEDGSVVEKVDVVVFATGYNYSFPFLPPALQEKSGYRLSLYKHVFPPRLSRPSLAVVGFVHGLGSLTPLAKMQARWATRVFKGLSNLPPEEMMLDEIATDTATMHKKYACSDRTPIQVDYLPYLDSLAALIGVRPNITRLLLSDPRLALQVLFGPCTSYQYRLSGPGRWAGARRAIFTQWNRVVRPFSAKAVPKSVKIRFVPRPATPSKDEPEPGRANIYRSVVINTSKEMMTFSDFPPPGHFPNNMHHSEVLLYLRLYAQSFGLLQRIRFQTTVVGMRPTPDFPATGRWEVETERRNGQRESQVFDAVMVCTGHYTTPHLPLTDFPGIEIFEGKYFHSWEYRSFDGLQGKRVVVVGMGNSGGDIAVDISQVAEKVYLSTRSGAWVLGRLGPGGLPRDFFGSSRLDALKRKLFLSWVNQKIEKKLNRAFDHRLYGIRPKHAFYSQIPVVNDDLAARILAGRVQVKPNLKRFTATDAIFDDGTVVHDVDVVLFATGYDYSLPFLPADLQGKCGPGSQHRLYRHVFALGLVRPTLAMIGLIDGFGAVNLLAELQARWATRVFKGLIGLPSHEVMEEDIEKERATMRKRFTKAEKNPLQVDFLPYLDSLAEEAGVRPNILRLFLSDPKLAWRVLSGPCTPYQFRLSGPGKWDGARRAILTQWERVHQPFRSRRAEPGPQTATPYGLIGLLSGVAILTFCFWKNHRLLSFFFL